MKANKKVVKKVTTKKVIKNKDKQEVTCFIHSDEWSAIWRGDSIKLKPNSTYQLIIDYPFNTPTSFPIKTGKKGLGFLDLIPKIGKAYEEKYNQAEEDDAACYWHGIEDLSLGGIYVNHKTKIITLGVDS